MAWQQGTAEDEKTVRAMGKTFKALKFERPPSAPSEITIDPLARWAGYGKKGGG